MGYLDRAVNIKGAVRVQSEKPQLRIYNYGFNINPVAVRMIGGKPTERYSLKIVPDENLLVFCKDDEGCCMNGSKSVYLCRMVLRRSLDMIIPRMDGFHYPTYLIDGEYIPEENIVVFDIKKAKRV